MQSPVKAFRREEVDASKFEMPEFTMPKVDLSNLEMPRSTCPRSTSVEP